MIKSEKIQKEIELTLKSLDGIKQAEANPFLFTRIQARMQAENSSWEKLFSFFNKPAISFSMVAFILVLNFLTLFISNTGKEENFTESEPSITISTSTDINSQYIATATNYDYVLMNNQ